MPPESATATATATALPTGTWKVDNVHSSVEFQVKHLGIATVKGLFKEFEGTLEVGPEAPSPTAPSRPRASTRASPSATSTCARPTSSTPSSTPRSASARPRSTPVGEDDFEIVGDITIHGVTGPLTLKATLEGTETDHQGNDRVGVSAAAQIDRKDFGMTFNAALGSGNLLVSDKVKILLDVSAVKA